MKKIYTLDYDYSKARVKISVDTDIFTEQSAKDTLDFFTWDYDKDADLIDEVVKKYAIEIIQVGSWYNYNVTGVKDYFERNEGFYPFGKKSGIDLLEFEPLELESDDIDFTVEEIE